MLSGEQKRSSVKDGRVYRRLSVEEKREISRRYLDGETSGTLARVFGCSDVSILNALKSTGTPRRDPSRARMIYPVWHEAFASVTPKMAYWTGFLMADGCVLDESKICLALAEKDKEHVAKFRSFLKTESRPIYDVPQNGSCALKIHSRQIVSDLARYGVVPRKSLIASACGGIDRHPAFWLGVMDGDGTIDTKRRTVKMVGTDNLMRQFSAFLATANVRGYRGGNKAPAVHRVGRRQTLHEVVITGQRAANFLRLVYASSPMWLDRKKARADAVIDQYLT